jgi:two-component system NtrC family sensor kinase
MKLQTKFSLGIIAIFVLLAAFMAALSIRFVNDHTIREAEDRIRIYMRAAWEIHDGKIARTHAALEILAQDRSVIDVLAYGGVPERVRPYLESVRRDQKMDILNVMTADGKVLLRTRAPYNKEDAPVADALVQQVIATRRVSSGAIVLEQDRLDVEGSELIERVLAVGSEPRAMFAGAAVPVIEDGKLVGIIEMGTLLNGATEKVDTIRDAVFENETYNGKPVGTATIFLGDLRISTNALDAQGRRAVGTRASKEVADRVLKEGLPWTGRAIVVDTPYLAQYDPIRDPEGRVIGMLYVGELEQKYLDLRTQAVAQNLGVILAGMIVAFLGSIFLVSSVVKPVQALAEATRLLSDGDLSHRVEIVRTDEIGDLARSFDQMGERLQAQRDELERDKQQLTTLSEQLQTTNRNYIEMLGFVTHELKNPLTSAIMGLYTVKDGYLGELNAAQKKSLESVAKSLDYFQDMVRNYLDLSRLEQGQLVANKRSFKLQEAVIGPSLESLERQMQDRHIVVDNRVPGKLVVNADPTLMRVVYDDLISNAVKYGREGGSILLEADERSDKLTLSVRNDGEGIPPEKQTQLFKRFSRLDTPSATGKKGTGLGLYICKEIVEKHGGEIWADSKIGEWVKFSFTLPNNVEH